MRIGELAQASGVPVKTLRYWEQVGVLDAPSRTPSGYREYSHSVADQIQFIRSAQAVGLSLEQIKGIMSLRSRGVTPCEHVQGLLQQQLDQIDAKLKQLGEARTGIVELIERAQRLDPADCSPESVCHVLQAADGASAARRAAVRKARRLPVTQKTG